MLARTARSSPTTAPRSPRGTRRYNDSDTGKPVGNVTRYTYAEPDTATAYVVTWTRLTDLTAAKLADSSRAQKSRRQLAGFDGAYLRFAGDLRIDHYRADALLESHTDARPLDHVLRQGRH